MSLADQPPMVKDEVADIGAALAAWYGSHCSIRRLRAIDESVALTVLVALEPTSDGDDTLPVWLAKQHEWTNDLTRCTDRAVQLKLIASSEFETHAVNGAAVIAELDWREAWTSAPESGREQSTGWRSP